MNIFDAVPPHIFFHALSATVALVLGPVALFRKRRDRVHKYIGYVWVLAMFSTAVSAFFIHSFAVIGPFSPLHGFALLTLWSLYMGVQHARQGRIREHELVFRNLYFFGLCLAGLANFLPGRSTNRLFFGEQGELGWAVIAAGSAALVIYALMQRSAQRGQAA